MITIESGHGVGYSQDDPVIVIKHQMNDRAMLADLLPHIIKKLGADAVRNELDKHVTAVEKGEFMCMVTGSGFAPTVTHAYLNHAEEEAKRLHEKSGFEVIVLRKVLRVKRVAKPAPPVYETVVEPIK